MSLNAVNISNTPDGPDFLDDVYGLTSTVIGGTTYLFATSFQDNVINVYRLQADGTPVWVSGTALLDTPINLSVAEVGGESFLLAGYQSSGSSGGLRSFQIAGDGSLTQVDDFSDDSASRLAGSFATPAVVEKGDRTFVYGTGFYDNGITGLELAEDGGLSFVTARTNSDFDFLSGAWSLATAEVGGRDFLIAAGRQGDALNVYNVGGTGQLSIFEIVSDSDSAQYGLDFISDVVTATVAGHSYVYAASDTENSISVFELSGNGQLEFVARYNDGNSTFFNGAYDMSVATYGGFSYLSVVGRNEDGITIFRISDGEVGTATVGGLTTVANIADDGTRLLDGSVSVHMTEVNGVPFVYSGGTVDDGFSGFRLDMPFMLDWQGTTYGSAETLAGALREAPAGAVIRAVAPPLYSETNEVVQVSQNAISVNLGSRASDTTGSPRFVLSDFARAFTVNGTEEVRVTGSAANAETITTGGGGDTVWSSGGNDTVKTRDGADVVYANSGADRVEGGNGGDELHGGLDNDTLIGWQGFDTLYGNRGADRLFGGDGDDTIFGGDGNDRAEGGVGADSLGGGNQNDTLLGQGGTDTLNGGAGADRLDGGAAGDTLFGGVGNDLILGGTGGDILAGGNDADTVVGGDGNDTLLGGGGNDTLNGGQGADLLVADGGSDRLVGGLGVDTFRFIGQPGVSTVVDFVDDVDRIDVDLAGLAGGNANSFNTLYGSNQNGNVVYSLDEGASILVVQNITLAQIEDDLI